MSEERRCTLALCGHKCACEGKNPTHPSEPVRVELIEAYGGDANGYVKCVCGHVGMCHGLAWGEHPEGCRFCGWCHHFTIRADENQNPYTYPPPHGCA